MDLKLNVLLVSRHKSTLDQLESVLRKQAGLQLQRKLTVNGHVDPLHDVTTMPDALVLHLAEKSQAELESLSARAVDKRPPLIAVGSGNDTNVMRLAMQAGARDLLPLPLVEADLIAALQCIARDRRATATGAASLIVFMNAKGGCGSTLLACNTAHALTAVSHRSVTLIDLDLQFGAIPVYFDLFPKRGVLQAFENIEGLDEAAFQGYLAQHSSGLRIMGHAADDALPTQAVNPQHVSQLLTLALRGSDHHIVLVVQQSVASVRDATRLMNCLRRELGVSKDRIVVVVNRYDKEGAIRTEDIRTTLACGELSLVPSDFRNVSECINTGMPLLDHARTAAVTRAVVDLHSRLGGNQADRQGLFARTISGLLKSRTTP
jgi:pilus assembly protein CpaE